MPLTGPPRQSGPAFLRELATHYSRSPKPAAHEAAVRLRGIALELEELQSMSEGVMRATPTVRDLTPGTETALARLRAAAQAPPPTPEQMAELRALRQGGHTDVPCTCGKGPDCPLLLAGKPKAGT